MKKKQDRKKLQRKYNKLFEESERRLTIENIYRKFNLNLIFNICKENNFLSYHSFNINYSLAGTTFFNIYSFQDKYAYII